MNKIIVPIDLTEVSANALKYAIDMFGSNSDFTLVHVTNGISTLSGDFDPAIIENRIQFLERRIESLVNDVIGVSQLPNNFTIEIFIGNPVSRIAAYIKKMGDFNSMVVGTRDQYDLFDKWMGTISLGLVKKTNIPIYLIPIYAKYDGIDKVMVASDYELSKTNAIINIAKWNRSYGAKVKFLHIHSDSSKNYQEERKEILVDLFRKGDPNSEIEMEIVHGKNIPDTLLGKAYNYHTNMLIVLPENHSFIHTLLFKSVSKELILKSDIPILFFPKDYKHTPQANHVEWMSSWKRDSITKII